MVPFNHMGAQREIFIKRIGQSSNIWARLISTFLDIRAIGLPAFGL